jgi:ribonuclease R
LIVHRILKQVLRQNADAERPAAPGGANTGAAGRGTMVHSETPSPWSKRAEPPPARRRPHPGEIPAPLAGPVPEDELRQIAEESSQSERRADDAERELMDWKKARFMEDRVGEDFPGLIISVTKFGFFVELTELFIEGLVPLASLEGDHYTYHDATREIIGQRTRKTYSLGDMVHVLVDRVDPVLKKIQFTVLPEAPARAAHPNEPTPGSSGTPSSRRRGKPAP